MKAEMPHLGHRRQRNIFISNISSRSSHGETPVESQSTGILNCGQSAGQFCMADCGRVPPQSAEFAEMKVRTCLFAANQNAFY
jgi:hypothetical protein